MKNTIIATLLAATLFCVGCGSEPLTPSGLTKGEIIQKTTNAKNQYDFDLENFQHNTDPDVAMARLEASEEEYKRLNAELLQTFPDAHDAVRLMQDAGL